MNRSRTKRQIDALRASLVRHRRDIPATAAGAATIALATAWRDLRHNPSNAMQAIESARALLDQFAC